MRGEAATKREAKRDVHLRGSGLDYSARSACIGSIEAARRAGMSAAARETSNMPNPAATKLNESWGESRKSMEAISLEVNQASGSPTTRPAPIRKRLSRTIIHKHFGAGCAERHAYTYFDRPARDTVGKRSVKTDSDQRRGQQRRKRWPAARTEPASGKFPQSRSAEAGA